MHDKAQPAKVVGVMIKALAVIVVGGLSAVSVSAQDTQVIGGHGGPSVEVDLSVLDSLPPLATLPELLRPGLLPHARASRERLPFRSERIGGRSLSMGNVRPAPRPIAKPTRPTVTPPKVAVPRLPVAKPAAPPAKPRMVAKSVPPAPAIPKVSSTAPVNKPKAKPVLVARPAPTRPQLAPKAPVIASKAPAPPKPMPTQTAARSVSAGTSAAASGKPVSAIEGGGARLLFDEDQSAFGDAMAAPLGVLIKDLKANDKRRVQLLAYAATADGNASKARRLSLSRALSVRAYLMSQGIASTRMDVRALGDRSEAGPANRVDVMVVAPR
jgi:outer membrane protein OmpA-like peptidoglycan-associated protein